MSLFSIRNFVLIFSVAVQFGCKKLVSVDTPPTSTNADIVFSDDATAAAVMTGIYYNLSSSTFFTGIPSLTLYTELAADNFTLHATNLQPHASYYRNSLSSAVTTNSGPNYWSLLYSIIYNVNSIIENAPKSSKLSETVKKQLLGEAYFMRGFAYFYLVNLYGDVPLVLTTSYKESAILGRESSAGIYQQMISDLKQAQQLLNENYVDASLLNPVSDRIRPNKSAATALLARAYLYASDFANAEIESSAVIENNTVYDTVPLAQAFIKNTKETIWSLQPVFIGENTKEARMFILPATGPNTNLTNPVYLSDRIITAFQPNDKRASTWIGSVTVGGIVYPYPAKYKIFELNSTVNEFSIVLRFAEQLLIRAEARAQLNNIPDGIADLNKIRARAGLADTTVTNKENLLNAILLERRLELFAEWGHRWFDLKRTGKADEIMPQVAIEKGSGWSTEWQLFPIPVLEFSANPKLTQNPGYTQ